MVNGETSGDATLRLELTATAQEDIGAIIQIGAAVESMI